MPPIFLPIAHAGCHRHTKLCTLCTGWWEWVGVISATPATPWIPAFAGMTKCGDEIIESHRPYRNQPFSYKD